MLLFLKHQLYSLNLGSEMAAVPSSKSTCLEDLSILLVKPATCRWYNTTETQLSW